MRTDTAPTEDARADRSVFPLGLRALTHRTFPQGTSRIDDDFSLRHFSDLSAAYGITHRPELAPQGNTFTTMARALLEGLAPSPPPAELAVVAHTTPDLDCRLAAVTCLVEVLPSRPKAFTISDCGSSAAFTALRVAGQYARRFSYRQVVLFVLDQASLQYETGRELAGDAGVALLLTTDAPTRLAPRQRTDVAPSEVPAALADLWAAAGGGPSVPVIAGPGLDPTRDLAGHRGRVVRAGAGYPASGVLGALATDPGWFEGDEGRIALADYDPTTRELNLCLIERPGV